jgi:ketosteroid isomerase-like protein
MSSANLDVVRSIFATWERGDFFGSADWADPEIEWVLADGPVMGSWKGMAGLAEGTRDVLGAWEEARIEPEDYRELDDERLLVLVRYAGRGRTSGLDLAQFGPKGAWLFHVRDGKVTRFVRYWNRERALADLGLAPEAGAAASPD